MLTSQNNESMDASSGAEVRKDAAATLGAVSSAVNPAKTGVGQKLAIAGALYRLAKRYPIPTLFVAGIALAIYVSRSHGHTPVARH